jgi:hypothetical protein
MLRELAAEGQVNQIVSASTRTSRGDLFIGLVAGYDQGVSVRSRGDLDEELTGRMLLD